MKILLPTTASFKRAAGFTLIETAVVVGLVACLATVGVVAYRNQGEAQEAILANSIQGSLQTALGQMSVRLERTPADVFTNFQPNLIQFARSSITTTITLNSVGNGIQLQFPQSGRTVVYGINANGDLVVTNETFTRFNADVSGQLAEI
jgi:type II secretory pathway pseudopilin PulG